MCVQYLPVLDIIAHNYFSKSCDTYVHMSFNYTLDS